VPRDGRCDAQADGPCSAARAQNEASKKIEETDAIFAHVAAARVRAAADDACLRISIDSKAKVKVGDFSRGGQSRVETKALDHDRHPEALLVPFGVLEVSRGTTPIHQLHIWFGHSRETAGFLVDAIGLWWSLRQAEPAGVKRLMIELDNGPELSSSRTQFLKRLIEFAHRTGLTIELVYGPPYHSKCNPIERCRGSLEQHWSGTLLSTVETVLKRAGTMTWRGLHPSCRN